MAACRGRVLASTVLTTWEGQEGPASGTDTDFSRGEPGREDGAELGRDERPETYEYAGDCDRGAQNGANGATVTSAAVSTTPLWDALPLGASKDGGKPCCRSCTENSAPISAACIQLSTVACISSSESAKDGGSSVSPNGILSPLNDEPAR